MSDSSMCRGWRGELAARALGQASPAAAAGLEAHLDGCPACREDLRELQAAAEAAALADPDRLQPDLPAPALAETIVARVSTEAATRRRTRRRRVALVAAAAGVVAALAIGVRAGDGDDDHRRVELAGAEGVAGSAVLTGRPWGTEVTLEVSGLEEGETYWLWLTSTDPEERVAAGTFLGTSRPGELRLSSAMPVDAAQRIWLTNEADQVVLDARLEPED